MSCQSTPGECHLISAVCAHQCCLISAHQCCLLVP
ncbi:unnamed protein product, partial [Staurois parvus]